nr:cohesin subunit SA-3-like [Taeniopygia guttata]
MALRHSPRLRASGSSRGSSSGAPGSGSGSGSGSAPGSSSPGSPEFPEDSDSGSDFEPSLRPRSKRGPPRGSQRSRAPKRSRLSGSDGRDPEPNSLFEAVFSGKVATEPLVDEWLERYRRDREGAFLELLNFTVRSCGCRGVVTPQMFRELQNSEIIRRLTETFQENSPEYPLSRRSPPWRRFWVDFGWNFSGFGCCFCTFLYIYLHLYVFIFIFSPELPGVPAVPPLPAVAPVPGGFWLEFQRLWLLFLYIYLHFCTYIPIYLYFSPELPGVPAVPPLPAVAPVLGGFWLDFV